MAMMYGRTSRAWSLLVNTLMRSLYAAVRAWFLAGRGVLPGVVEREEATPALDDDDAGSRAVLDEDWADRVDELAGVELGEATCVGRRGVGI